MKATQCPVCKEWRVQDRPPIDYPAYYELCGLELKHIWEKIEIVFRCPCGEEVIIREAWQDFPCPGCGVAYRVGQAIQRRIKASP